MQEFLRRTILCTKKRWCILFIAQRICLNLLIHANVCSPAWVLKWGCSSFIFSGEKVARQYSPTWFLKWNTSIIFWTSNHTISRGGGKGSGFRATLRRSRLHMLSYARITVGFDVSDSFISASNHCSKIRNTCDGDSLLYGGGWRSDRTINWDVAPNFALNTGLG